MANKMQTLVPTSKVTFGAVAGAVAAIIVWIIEVAAKINVPGYIAIAISTVLTFFTSYFVPPADRDTIESS